MISQTCFHYFEELHHTEECLISLAMEKSNKIEIIELSRKLKHDFGMLIFPLTFHDSNPTFRYILVCLPNLDKLEIKLFRKSGKNQNLHLLASIV